MTSLALLKSAVNDYVLAVEKYLQLLQASWQSTFAHGVNSPEEIKAGLAVVPALRKYVETLTALSNIIPQIKSIHMIYNYKLPDGETGSVNAESPDHARDQIYFNTGVRRDAVKLTLPDAQLPVAQNEQSVKRIPNAK